VYDDEADKDSLDDDAEEDDADSRESLVCFSLLDTCTVVTGFCLFLGRVSLDEGVGTEAFCCCFSFT